MNPKCVQCEKTDSILWRKNSENAEVCNECYEATSAAASEEIKEEKKNEGEKTADETPKEVEATTAPETKVRKSTRSTRFKSKAVTRQKTKSVSRRANAFKSTKPFKTPSNICAETRTKTNLFLDGFYYQIGDIVSLMSRGELRRSSRSMWTNFSLDF